MSTSAGGFNEHIKDLRSILFRSLRTEVHGSESNLSNSDYGISELAIEHGFPHLNMVLDGRPTANTNETSNVTSLPALTKPHTSKAVIAANITLLVEQLEVGQSEGLNACLTAMRRFHNQSFGNILEIARQSPLATRVAGLYAWESAFALSTCSM